MSKERKVRRAEREREAAIRAAARARAEERRQARAARTQRLTRWVPSSAGRQTGILAQRRRQQVALTIAVLVFLNVLVWVFVPGWAARAFAVCVSLLAAPVLHTMLFRR